MGISYQVFNINYIIRTWQCLIILCLLQAWLSLFSYALDELLFMSIVFIIMFINMQIMVSEIRFEKAFILLHIALLFFP